MKTRRGTSPINRRSSRWDACHQKGRTILAECCRRSGERVFSGREAVLERMTCREMEELLGALAMGEAPAATAGVSGENPGFDIGRFARLKEGGG